VNPELRTPGNRRRLMAILAIALLAVFVIPRSATVVTDLVWPLVSTVDPEKVFLWLIIHHVLVLAFTVLVMKFIFRIDFRQWGFNLNKLPESLWIIRRFVPFYFGVVLLLQLPNVISGNAPSFDYPLTAKNMTGYLGFQFLLTGTAEEPLFRGLLMTVLAKYMTGVHRIGDWEIPSTGLVATILFMLAHIGYTFSPFAITHFSLFQQFGAFGLGLFYAIVFHRTGSLLAPIILHGYSNVILILSRYSLAFLFS